MKTYLIAIFVALLVSSNIQAIQTESVDASNPTTLDLQTTVVVHIDVDRITESSSGRHILQTAVSSPLILEQLASIPEKLHFLKKADVHLISILEFEVDGSRLQLLDIVADFDQARFKDLLGEGHQYAQVEYHGVAIHQWVTDLEKLAKQFMGVGKNDCCHKK